MAHEGPAELRNTLGIAVGMQTYKAYRDVLESDRFQRLENIGARAQRLLFASTGVKDKNDSDTLYIARLAAPNTVNTMPEETLLAFADHGPAPAALPRNGGELEAVLSAHAKAGVDLPALAERLQSDGAKGFVDSGVNCLRRLTPRARHSVDCTRPSWQALAAHHAQSQSRFADARRHATPVHRVMILEHNAVE